MAGKAAATFKDLENFGGAAGEIMAAQWHHQG